MKDVRTFFLKIDSYASTRPRGETHRVKRAKAYA